MTVPRLTSVTSSPATSLPTPMLARKFGRICVSAMKSYPSKKDATLRNAKRLLWYRVSGSRGIGVANRSNDAALGARRARVQPARHAPGEECLPPGGARVFHRIRHEDRVLRFRNRRIHEHSVTAELHRDRRVARRTDTGVHDDGNLRVLQNDPKIVRIPDPQAGSNRRRERHDRRAPEILELLAYDGIVHAVR